MYSEGEHLYHKDLDWVNIVKSIRELRALTKIILNKQQIQLLAFEKDSILPSITTLEKKNERSLQNQLLLEGENSLKCEEYSEKVENFIGELRSEELSQLDLKIINEIIIEDKVIKKEASNQKRISSVSPKISKDVFIQKPR